MHSRQRHSEGMDASVESLALADRVRGILTTKGLTLYQVCALTRVRYPREPSYHIPRNFYFQLRSAGVSPTIQQLVALGELSGYRLADWLAVFGFVLDEIPSLQAALPHPHTIVFDNAIYDDRRTIPWFRERPTAGSIPSVAPLSQLLESSGSRAVTTVASAHPGAYLYVKIGLQDAFAFPDLIPGSIVRVIPRLAEPLPPKPEEEISKHIFLVEHSRGVCCSRLYFGTPHRVTLTPTQLPFANVEFQLGSEARILGIVDLEFRPLPGHKRNVLPPRSWPEVAADLAKLWTPAPLRQAVSPQRPGALLRIARMRAGLSFRQASDTSRAIATALGDERYFTSPGSLSDFEARASPPRHIHKLLTVCILYSIRFPELLNSFGLAWSESVTTSIPNEWLPRQESQRATLPERMPTGGFLTTLARRFGDLPLFLRHSLASLSGLLEISLRDVFWVGGQHESMHPSLAGALFVIVDRRKRRPRIFPRKSPWEQPLYLLMRRDGSYVLASCGLEDGAIIVHPYTEGFTRPERLRDRVEAEVVGQIVTLLRELPSSP